GGLGRAVRDHGEFGGEEVIEARDVGRLGVQTNGDVVSRLRRGRIGRRRGDGRKRSRIDVKDGVGRVNGVDRVVDGGPQDRQGACRLLVPLAAQLLHVQEQLVPIEDGGGRRQGAVFQRFEAEQASFPESHGKISFGPRYKGETS